LRKEYQNADQKEQEDAQPWEKTQLCKDPPESAAVAESAAAAAALAPELMAMF